MSSFFTLLRTTRRTGARGLIGLALLVGLAGGAVLAGLESARRTDTAFDRLVTDTEGWDILVNPDSGIESPLDMADVAALSGVEEASRIEGVALFPPRIESLTELDTGPTAFASDGRWAYEFARPLVTDGRVPDPDAPDEIMVSAGAADYLDLEVGDTYDVRLLGFEDFGAIEEAGGPEEMISAFNDPTLGRSVALEVVGVGTWFDEIVVDEGFQGGSVLLTPAFYEAYDQPTAGYWGGIVQLEPGTNQRAFRAQVEALAPDEPIAFQSQRGVSDQFDRAVMPHVWALVVFTAVAALVGLVVVGQAVSRRLAQDGGAFASLGALGVTRRQRTALGLGRIAIVGVVGSVIAVAVAVVASPIGPVGVAREAEPDPGIATDVSVLVLGGLAVFAVTLLLAVWPAVASTRQPKPVEGRSGVSAVTAGLGLRPPATTGLRFALERGAVGVPARSTLIGAVTSVALVVATVVFSANLEHLVENPALYGTPFNAVFDVETGEDEDPGPAEYGILLDDLADRNEVTAFGLIFPGQLSVEGRPVAAMSIDASSKPLEVTMLEGRAPSGPTEVAVGSKTLDDLDIEVGDRVTLDRAGEETEVAVTGVAVLPVIASYSGADKTTLGEGVLADRSVLQEWGPEFTPYGVATQVEGLDDPMAMAEGIDVPPPLYVDGIDASTPSDIESLERVRATPLVLTGLLAALIGLTVVHALAAAVRSRRRELAVLRTVGFTRGQVLRAVAVQALAISAVGLLIGIPLGTAAGRLAWTLLAEGRGAVVELVTPLLAYATLACGVAAIALLAGLWPGLHAASAHPATILRTE
jgi:FtsX-like permease family